MELDFSLPPSAADASIARIYETIDSIKDISPHFAALGATVIGALYLRDHYQSNGSVNRLAIRDLTGNDSRRKSARRLLLSGSAITMAVATFALGGEEAVRTGQIDAFDAVTERFEDSGQSPNLLIITQGSVDTPMDDSFIPAEVAETTMGSGFYVILPKIESKNGERMDGLVFGIPGLNEGEVQITNLTGAGEGEQLFINGVEFEVDEMLSDGVTNLRREVGIVSLDVAQEVMHLQQGDGSYYGLFVSEDDASLDDFQTDLDVKYGDGAYSVQTLEEYRNGIEKFMGNNGTGVLTLVMAGFIIAGASAEISKARKDTEYNRQNISLLRALGSQKSLPISKEVLKTAYRLAASLPATVIASQGITMGINAIEPGLGAEVTSKNLAAIFIVTSGPAIVGSALSSSKIAKSVSPIDNLRQN